MFRLSNIYNIILFDVKKQFLTFELKFNIQVMNYNNDVKNTNQVEDIVEIVMAWCAMENGRCLNILP